MQRVPTIQKGCFAMANTVQVKNNIKKIYLYVFISSYQVELINHLQKAYILDKIF